MPPQIAIFLGLLAYLTLIPFPGATALRQIVHDENFQPNYILRVTHKEVSIACRSRLTALVNGTSPGPTIYMRENQTTWVRVYNDLDSQNLTMHWHGLSQSTAPYSDGTPQASQWPIKAGHFFDYEIRPQLGEAGSYFYHSHVEFQAASVAGPLIVEEQLNHQPPFSYDHEKILFLSELYNKTDKMVMDGLTNPPTQFSWSGEAETILVNGKSYRGLDANESQTPEPWTKPDPLIETACGPEIIEVEPDKTYRMRAIGGQALSMISFAFEDHQNLSIISADAGYTRPTETDRIQIGGGQRFDFLLHTKTESELQMLGKSIFWVQLETRYRPTNVTSYALLSYKTHQRFNSSIPSSPPADAPLILPNQVQNWMEYTLEPLEPNGFPSTHEVSRQVYLTSAQLSAQNGLFWSANNRTWTETNQHLGNTSYNITSSSVGIPYLVNVYEHGEKSIPNYETAVQNYGGWDPELNVYVAKVGEVIDIILINEPDGLVGGFDIHPWHIHGGHVYDLGSGPGVYNATANEKKLNGYNPVLRDTTYLYKYTTTDDVGANDDYTSQGWRAWRMRVEDAGVWMVHCHILQHMIMGMQSVWVVGNASQITHGTTPDLVRGYLTYGGNAYGNTSYDPLVNHYYDD